MHTADNSQQQGPSPSQIAAAARGEHEGGQTHGGRSPSEIAVAARGGVHGPESGQSHGIHGNSGPPDRSPSQIAADAVSNVHGQSAGQDGHTLLSDPKTPEPSQPEWGERSDGKTWVQVEEERAKNRQDNSGEDQRGRGRSPSGEQPNQQEKGPSLSEQVHEWVHEIECGY